MARGQMLGSLCDMFEQPEFLFTRNHSLVQIDNELMFSENAGANLWRSQWIREHGQVKRDGLALAIQLCEEVVELPDQVFLEAIQLPEAFKPEIEWCLDSQVECIRPRARKFLLEHGY